MYWQGHRLEYLGYFDSIPLNGDSKRYRIELLSRTSGRRPPQVKTLYFSTNPCIISYLEDEPLSPIKGCEVTLNLLNINNQSPLSKFYSDTDDYWKIKIYSNWATVDVQLEFEGFLVQDTCEEIQTDIAHEVVLRFTDGLGLLKSINFYDANRIIGAYSETPRTVNCGFYAMKDDTNLPVYPAISANVARFIIYDSAHVSNPQPFDTLYVKIISTNLKNTVFNGVYLINKVESVSIGYHIYINEPILYDTNNNILSAELTFITPLDLNYKCKLSHILKVCLQNTGVNFETWISNKIQLNTPTYGDSDNIFDNIYIEPNSFSNNKVWDSCYDVLGKIFDKFKFTIFQGKGRWNIMRFTEFRFNQTLGGYTYDYSFENFTQFYQIEDLKSIGYGDDIEYGLLSSIIRPLKYRSDTYKYDQRDNLIINSDFFETGEPLGNNKSQYQDIIKFRNYKSKYWTFANDVIPDDFTIIEGYIDTDNFGNYNTYARYAEVAEGTFDEYHVRSRPIEINAGDKIDINFNISLTPIGYQTTTRFPVVLSDGTTNLAIANIDINGDPITQMEFTAVTQRIFKFSENTTGRQVHSISMSAIAPISGLLTIYLPRGFEEAPQRRMAFKDFKITISPAIISNSTIINQIDKSINNNSLKNIEEYESKVGDTPRNFVSGTLYIFGVDTDGTRLRTVNWREKASGIYKSVAKIINTQVLLYLSKNRCKLEGKILLTNGVSKNIINPSFLINYQKMPGLKFIFGKMDINLKEDFTTCTLYEICKTDEASIDLDEMFNNSFNYTYQSK